MCVCVYLSNHGCLIERGEKLKRDLEHMREGEGERVGKVEGEVDYPLSK